MGEWCPARSLRESRYRPHSQPPPGDVFRIAGFLGARLPDGAIGRIVANPLARVSLYGLFFGRPSRHEAADLIRDLRALGREHRPAIDAALAELARWPIPRPAADVPTTIAWGGRDLLLFPHQSRRARKAFPAARFVPLPGLGHVPMSDDPERIAALLLESSRAG